MPGEPLIHPLVDNGHGVVAVERFEVGARDLEVGDSGITVDDFVEQAGGILHKLGVVKLISTA